MPVNFWPKSRKFHSTMSLAPRMGQPARLAGIAASLARFDERPNQVPICERWVIPPPLEEEKKKESKQRETEESLPISATQNQTEDWRKPIINFLRHKYTPGRPHERVQIRGRTAPRCVFINDILYRRSTKVCSFVVFQKEEGLQVLKETHGGICAHIKLAQSSTYRSKDFGYYWPTMLGTPSKWLEPANRANSMPITYINHRCRFTQRSLPGH
ncbi:hypothetical protein H6P81_010290 [Aristolochia fimbriata]|uniref:Uncharacterized protein n=1 Tax=Aristolochia fimbriata TaxID=158543 RepID=A0AAV7EQG3_ARIFI|nr:hypothetical protein H6P81_010290 [Aristolochia fimbriata]